MFNKRFFILPGIRINYFSYIEKFSFDPRATIEYRFNDENKVYISAGYLSQFTTEPFILANLTDDRNNLKIPAAWHYVVGESSKFLDHWEISIEAYMKNYVNVISRVSNIKLEFKTTDNRFDIYGAEILLKKNPGGIPVYGWLSGSIMNCWYYVTEGEDPNTFYGFNLGIDQDNNIYGGAETKWEYASPPLNEWYNVWHYKFNLTLIWEFLKNWALTTEFIYKSRGYVTPVESATPLVIGTNTIYMPNYGKYLSEKLPDYHELNLKLEWTPRLFGLPCGLYIQVNNIYNNRQFYYVYNEDYSERETVYSPLGIYGYGGFWIRW